MHKSDKNVKSRTFLMSLNRSIEKKTFLKFSVKKNASTNIW